MWGTAGGSNARCSVSAARCSCSYRRALSIDSPTRLARSTRECEVFVVVGRGGLGPSHAEHTDDLTAGLHRQKHHRAEVHGPRGRQVTVADRQVRQQVISDLGDEHGLLCFEHHLGDPPGRRVGRSRLLAFRSFHPLQKRRLDRAAVNAAQLTV